MSQESPTDRAFDFLLGRILDGDYQAGDSLPAVRELAREVGVNISTVQRALDRISEHGLLRRRWGVGIEVRDPRRYGGTLLWRAAVRRGSAGVLEVDALIADLLRVRRILAQDVLSIVLTNQPSDGLIESVQARIDEYADAIARDDKERMFEVEHDIVRDILLDAHLPAALCILNDYAAVIAEAPTLVAAMFAEPSLHLAVWRMLVMRPRPTADSERLAQIVATIAAADAEAIRAYLESMEAR